MESYKNQGNTYFQNETIKMARVDLQIKCHSCQVELKFLPEYLDSLVACPECFETFKCTRNHLIP